MNIHAKNIFWVYFFTFLGAPLAYLIRLFYAHDLSLEDYGIFYGLFGFFMLFGFLRDWGMNGAVVYYINQYLVQERHDKIKTLFWFNHGVQFGLSIIIGILLFLFRDYIYLHLYPIEKNIREIFPLFIIYWSVSTIFTTNSMFFTVFQNQKMNGIFNTLNYLLIILFSYFLTLTELNNYYIPVLAYVISFSLISIFSLLYIVKKYSHYLSSPAFYKKIDLFKEAIIYSNSLVIAGFAGIIFFSTDTIIVQYFKGAESVAYFTTAVATASLMMFLIDPFYRVVQPVVASLWHKKKGDKINKIMTAIINNYLILILPLSLIMSVFSEQFILNFYGSKFIFAAELIQILVFGILLTGINSLLGMVLGATGNPKILSKTALIAGVINLLISIILINLIGLIGVVIALLLASFVRCGILIFYVKRIIGLRISIFHNLKIIFAAIVFLLLSLFLKKQIYCLYSDNDVVNFLLNGVFVFTIASIAYVVTLFKIGVLKKSQFKNIYSQFFIKK